MDRMTNIYASAATYKQPANGHDADRLLTTPQLVTPPNMKPSQGTNLSERTVSLMVAPLQQKASLPPIIPLHIETEMSHPDESKPLLPKRHNRTQLIDEFTSLWQQITETNVLKNFIISLFFPNKVSALTKQLNALTLTYDEQLQTLTNFYVIKFGEHLNRAIQGFRNDRKTVEHHLRTPNHPPMRASALPAVLNQVEACINDSFDIKRHLTNLSQSHYTMSMDDPEHKELDECNMHLQTEHQKDLEISSTMKLSFCFSNDLLRGMNVALYSPSGHVLLRIYGNTKTCSYEESEESGNILEQMTLDTDNLTDLVTQEKKFQARIKAKFDKILGSPKLVHTLAFFCSQKSANIFHNLLNLYFIGKNLILSLPEREIRTEARILDNGDVSVRTILSLQKHTLVDSRSGDTSTFDIDQMVEVEALSVITADCLNQPHFHTITVKILEPVSIQLNRR
ncbi:hypothetical protein [Endozoicomonas atrinae]|uniref:hypothetical protein n=1 Tax=Endozoicomonas atrinae TaxID=1333660 RepID=UPI0008248532|nr:hypothetical protein [Endozoicomonas atrinae]